MANWRDIILKEFPAQVCRLTVVADPDLLLTEEGILQELKTRGYDLITYEDPIEFRFAYESRYRSLWDQNKSTDLVVVLRARQQDFRSLPFDLYQAGRKVSFDLSAVFPNLSYPVVDALNRSHYEALFQAQQQYNPGRLGDNQTKDFILLHVFELEPKLIKEPAHLLHALLRKHYRRVEIPRMLDDRIVEVLSQNKRFGDWPVDELVSSRGEFFMFLQERWPIFIERACHDPRIVSEGAESYNLKFRGPAALPFEHADVRVYLDDLFDERILEPVQVPSGKAMPSAWMQHGVVTDRHYDSVARAERLRASLAKGIPGTNASHADWLGFAYKWAELVVATQMSDQPVAPESMAETRIGQQVDDGFSSWVSEHFASLHNQPPDPPIMVHHVPRYLSHMVEAQSESRVALLVVDGLSLPEWIILRDSMKKRSGSLRIDERGVFAWIPTLTSVSRQALFSGKAPLYFPDSIGTSGKDELRWKQFWQGRSLNESQVHFVGGGDTDKLSRIREAADDRRIRALGVVVTTVDEIMHGMRLGMSGMFGQTAQWADQGLVYDAAVSLLDAGFRVFLCSDHGNAEATGIGTPSEGSLAESKGQRVRVYSDGGLRESVHKGFPDAMPWPPLGLPPDYLPLLAAAGKAFVQTGETVVSHGGAMLEEVVVPFVEISKS